MQLRVELTRLGNKVDVIDFRPQDDFLRATASVHEPHSFVVSIDASHKGERHQWAYESFEGRTRIAPEMAAAFSLATEIAGPAVLQETVTLYGHIVPRASACAR